MKKKLTNKEEMFIREYLVDNNGARAARAAGYSVKTARNIANENLSKPHIINRIMEVQEERLERLTITTDMKHELLWSGAQNSHAEGDFKSMKACIAELNRMQGDIAPTKTEQKTEHSGEINVDINVEFIK